jgi:16S rRNA (uracil1498-N3)-methyltransferase
VPGPHEALRRSAAHVFVEDLSAPSVDDQVHHHLATVLRLRDGEVVSLSDGRGAWCPGRYEAGRVVAAGPVTVVPPPSPELTVAFAPPKGDRPEAVVRALTELGVDVVIPFTSGRSVVRWDGDRGRRRHQRLVRVAREAAMQSRRIHLPRIEPVTTLEALAAAGPMALADPDGEPLGLGTTMVAIGPEGGWEPAERALGTTTVALGTGILRSETAAVAAGVLLSAQRASRGLPDR